MPERSKPLWKRRPAAEAPARQGSPRIVLHAGLPKTGTTSIQWWLQQQAQTLLDAHGITLLQTAANSGTPHIAPYVRGTANSSVINYQYNETGKSAEYLDGVLTQLVNLAHAHHTVVLSAEDVGFMFSDQDASALALMDRVGQQVQFTVAYYVRPQHSMLESLWQQSGFRRPPSPSQFVAKTAPRLRYLDTLRFVRDAAPSIEFVVRPFRRDLLELQSVVSDFAIRFLDVKDDSAATFHVNERLPLDLVNLLRFAPKQLQGAPSRALHHRVADEANIEDSDEVLQARRLLHAFAYQTYEADNRALMQELGVGMDHFIDAPETTESSDLADLDRLWTPIASSAVRELFFASLRIQAQQ